MEFLPFPARLRSDYNHIEEYGQGQVFAQDDAIDFTSEFIPLLPLGASATVEWLLGSQVVQTYHGVVYLSSAGLLRLIRVPKNLIADTRTLLANNLSIPVTLLLPGEPSEPVQAQAIYLTSHHVTVLTPVAAEPGSRLLLNAEVDFLTLRKMPLQVRTRVILRKSQSLLLCTVQETGTENRIALSAYVARLEKLKNRP